MSESKNMSSYSASPKNSTHSEIDVIEEIDLESKKSDESPGENLSAEYIKEKNEVETNLDGNSSLEDQGHQNKREGHSEKFSSQFEIFKKQFESQTDNESKLQIAINFMETTLQEGGTPHFRSFWEARRLCLSLFKENISSNVRSQLWNRYSELSKEARRLKEILDEQSSFAVEQIEIAIHALENELTQFEEQKGKGSYLDLSAFPQSLKNNYDFYRNLQKQLDILNVQASRINALRKELLKTDMRIRFKNKFFQRLSLAGDKVFPIRKDIIREISQQFIEDVDQFILHNFGSNEMQESFFVLREEIKSFQSLAKVLTLNTQAFTQTRSRLSECWDKIKIEEKERKKDRAQQKVLFKQNASEIESRIQELKEAFEKNEQTISIAQKNIDEIVNQMRQIELGKDELKHLRDSLNDIRKLIKEKVKAEEEARHEKEKESNRQKKEKFFSLKELAEQLIQNCESEDVDTLITNRDDLIEQIHNSSLSKNEKQELERILKPLRDIITEKKEKALLALPEDDRQALQQMKSILNQRKERRQEIKNQLEILRKAMGSSSLDFEKAMSFNVQINEEKERLDKANQAISEIETYIFDLQTKIRG